MAWGGISSRLRGPARGFFLLKGRRFCLLHDSVAFPRLKQMLYK